MYHLVKTHFVADRQTNGQYHAQSQSYCTVVRVANWPGFAWTVPELVRCVLRLPQSRFYPGNSHSNIIEASYHTFKKSQQSRPLLTTALQTATFSYWDTVPSLNILRLKSTRKFLN